MDTFGGLPPELWAEVEGSKRREQIAQALIQQSMQPMEAAPVKGRFQGSVSPLAGVAKLIQAYTGGVGMKDAEATRTGIAGKYQAGLADAVSKYAQMKAGTPAVPGQTAVADTAQEGTGSFDMGGAAGPAVTTTGGTPEIPGDPRAAIVSAMSSPYAPMQRMAGMDLTQLNRTEDRKDTQTFQTAQLKMQFEARAQEIKDKAAEGRISREEADKRAADLRREMQAAGFAQQQSMAGIAASLRQPPPLVSIVGPDGKAKLVPQSDAVGQRPYDKKAGGGLPPAALKLQQEEVEAIGIASSINADLGALDSQITAGTLKPALIGNLESKARNKLGISTPESRNLATFEATLEKLRNDSLKLNKGVQTEGDAQRAWNELIKDINDKDLVQQRLKEIQKINDRAVNLRKQNISIIRGNFGADPLETGGLENQPAAVGGAAYAGPERRTGNDDPLGIRKKP